MFIDLPFNIGPNPELHPHMLIDVKRIYLIISHIISNVSLFEDDYAIEHPRLYDMNQSQFNIFFSGDLPEDFDVSAYFNETATRKYLSNNGQNIYVRVGVRQFRDMPFTKFYSQLKRMFTWLYSAKPFKSENGLRDYVAVTVFRGSDCKEFTFYKEKRD